MESSSNGKSTCPTDKDLTWTYTGGSDCSLIVVCGLVDTTVDVDIIGNASLITTEKELVPTVTSSSIDCGCADGILLTSACVASEAHSSKLGEYQEICSTDQHLIYSHVDGTIISYLYYTNYKWLISPQINDPVAWIGIPSLQVCPIDEEKDWQAFTGQVNDFSRI